MDSAVGRELLAFLGPGARADVKLQALHYILGLSGTAEGRRSLCDVAGLPAALFQLTSDPAPAVLRDAHHILVNLTSDPAAHRPLLDVPDLLPTLIGRLLDPRNDFADSVCSALCNLSRQEGACRAVLATMATDGLTRLLDALCGPKYNPTASLDYLGPLLCNLTQLPQGRDFILDRNRCVIQRLLPLAARGSVVRRGGIVGTLRNCCFNHCDHTWLLGEEVDLLPFLLLPLAGGEEYTDQEMEALPLDLQYLPQDKEREPDPDIRKMLIECLQLLCATPAGRRVLKDRGVYLVMRSLHSWEAEPDVKRTCEKLIQVLIGDEPEPGLENLLEVQVPPDVEEKLKRLDEEEEELQAEPDH
ncbi:protein HGH1 homolog [Gastrophryne carolinensis]